MELIKLKKVKGRQIVSARDLHKFLASKKDFSSWVKTHINKYGLVENQDYFSFTQKVEREIGGTTRIEYALTLDCAKELAMVAGTEKGRQARKYFIECEKKLKQASSVKALSPAEALLQSVQLLAEQEQRLSTMENKVKEIEAKTTTRPEYFSVAGYGVLHGHKFTLKESAQLGRRASKLCVREHEPIDTTYDPRFGKVNLYPKRILEHVFKVK